MRLKAGAWIACLCLGLSTTPGRAEDACAASFALRDLQDLLTEASSLAGLFEPVNLRRLAEDLHTIRVEAQKLGGQTALPPGAGPLVEAGTLLMESQGVWTRVQIAYLRRGFPVDLLPVCGEIPYEDERQQTSQLARTTPEDWNKDVLGGSSTGRGDDPLSPSLEATLPILALLGMVVLLILLHGLWNQIYGRIYNRRACRIPATLRIGEAAFRVTVNVLGRKGCRCELYPEEDIDVVHDLVETDDTWVDFGSAIGPGHVFRLRDRQVSLFFEAPLGLKLQRQVLEGSLGTTRIIARDGKPKVEIAPRKLKRKPRAPYAILRDGSVPQRRRHERA